MTKIIKQPVELKYNSKHKTITVIKANRNIFQRIFGLGKITGLTKDDFKITSIGGDISISNINELKKGKYKITFNIFDLYGRTIKTGVDISN